MTSINPSICFKPIIVLTLLIQRNDEGGERSLCVGEELKPASASCTHPLSLTAALPLCCSAALRLRQLTGGLMRCRGGAVLRAPRARNFPVSCECDSKVKRSSRRVNTFILWIAPRFRQELCWIMEWLDGMKSVRKRDAWKRWIGFSLEHLGNARYWKVSQILKWEWSICLLWNRQRNPCRYELHGRAAHLPAAHHPGDYVHFRGGGERHRHRGSANITEGAEGDDFLHACVWPGGHGPPGHPAGQPCHHRHLHEGLVAGRRAAVSVLRLHPHLLLLGPTQHCVRNVSGEVHGDQPRVFLQPVRQPEARRAHSPGHLHLQHRVLRAAQHGARPGKAPELEDLVLHRLAEQPHNSGDF